MEAMINFLGVALDGAAQRQKALANNLANISTPGYKRKDVDFTSTLKNLLENKTNFASLSLKTSHQKHIQSTSALIPFKAVYLSGSSYRNDGNNVDVEYEMAELAKNYIYYNTLAQQIDERFTNLKTVIEKGGR